MARRRRILPRGILEAELAEQEHHEPVEDVERVAEPPTPPLPGAQWDELHGRWERWNDATEAWVVVGDDGHVSVAPDDENPLPPLLAREVLHAEDLDESEEHVPDVERVAEPPTQVPGAQWNEVEGRWERWDDAAGHWIPVDDEDEGEEG